MLEKLRFYIDGQWVDPVEPRTLDVINPATEATLTIEPFVSSKSDSRGLGLSLVAKAVGDHGGVVEFDSEPGATVFRLMLPAAQGEGQQP